MNARSSIATVLGFVAALTLWFAMTQIAPTQAGEFSIILSQNSTRLVVDADILSYNPKSHEFTLTSECSERLKPMGLFGDFKVVIDGETVLTGTVVPSTVSRSYDESQVVLLYPTFNVSDMNYKVMKLQMGYPWDLSSILDFTNPLDNAKIVAHFMAQGKLIE